jgi:hypothetical protein
MLGGRSVILSDIESKWYIGWGSVWMQGDRALEARLFTTGVPSS